MDTDLGVGFLLFRGTWRLVHLSSGFGLCPCRGYTVRRCLPAFPYLTFPHLRYKPNLLFLLNQHLIFRVDRLAALGIPSIPL